MEEDKKGQKRSVDDQDIVTAETTATTTDTTSILTSNDNAAETATAASAASKQTLYRGKFRGYKKHTRLFATSEQVKGFLVACEKARDSQSISETMDLLHFYALKFLPEFKDTIPLVVKEKLPKNNDNDKKDGKDGKDGKENEEDDEEDDDGEEVEIKKTETGELVQTRKRFELINSACGGLYVISIVQEDVNPVDFGSAIIVDLYNRFKHVHTYEDETAQQERFKNLPQSVKDMLANAKPDSEIPKHPTKNIFNIRFTFRLIPFQRSTQTVMVDFAPVISNLIKDHFGNNDTKSTFSIEYRTRNSHKCGKEEVIESVAKLLTNKVDLSNPDVTIIIEVIKSAMCTSVVRGFKSLFKFNIKEVIHGNDHRFAKQKQLGNNNNTNNNQSSDQAKKKQKK
ncbi:hypothetical protein DFA_04141 [Cavenderia fasciculata]|uniref:THUMP domain-containing protein n=1 Tax=Cavenderia fasciculata TaxID=261658 RepID=F4Q1E5_CACFS|nr:uncharacterized protein DFA_04141 [Cavenderia fasciculata]EGG18646.1 hypothetical protein DFA_04141 [Cavenderia fasciculata]|eukprot:XP_004366550.1 hypothetical protein DFA_04141 [Cavenderia fasciculata]